MPARLYVTLGDGLYGGQPGVENLPPTAGEARLNDAHRRASKLDGLRISNTISETRFTPRLNKCHQCDIINAQLWHVTRMNTLT